MQGCINFKLFTMKYSLIFLFFLSSCTLLFKTSLSIKNPKVETNEQILEYLEKTKCLLSNSFVIDCQPDSLQIYKNLMKGFTNEVLIYKDSVRYCYNAGNKCKSKKLRKTINEFNKFYAPCKKDTIDFDIFLSQLIPLSENNKLQIKQGKIYIFAYWSIFFGSKKDKKDFFNWLYEYYKEYPDKYEIIIVNTDLNYNWGLEKGEEMKLKFKMTNKNSVDLEFGKIPYRHTRKSCCNH